MCSFAALAFFFPVDFGFGAVDQEVRMMYLLGEQCVEITGGTAKGVGKTYSLGGGRPT